MIFHVSCFQGKSQFLSTKYEWLAVLWGLFNSKLFVIAKKSFLAILDVVNTRKTRGERGTNEMDRSTFYPRVIIVGLCRHAA